MEKILRFSQQFFQDMEDVKWFYVSNNNISPNGMKYFKHYGSDVYDIDIGWNGRNGSWNFYHFLFIPKKYESKTNEIINTLKDKGKFDYTNAVKLSIKDSNYILLREVEIDPWFG